jgi:hypothetical protein
MPLLTSLIAAAVLGQQTAPPPKEVKTFVDKFSGVMFDYPKEWRYRKERLYSKIEFPLADGKKAEVQLLSSDFRQSKQQWQDIQVEINTSVLRQVEGQSEELVLGVPLLLTKLNYKEENKELSTLVGMLYSKTPEKFTFRLTAPTANYAEAETIWRGVMNSLRPIGDKLPEIEVEGSVDVRPVPDSGNSDTKTIILKPEEPGSKQNLKGLRKTSVTVGEAPMDLWLPKGWEVAPAETKFSLTSKGLKGKVIFETVVGGVPEAQASVLDRMNTSMARFTAITLRKEYEVKGTKAGCALVRAERIGSEGETPLVVVYAAGVRGETHWLLTYEVKSVDDWKDDQDKLAQLFDGMVLQAPAAP